MRPKSSEENSTQNNTQNVKQIAFVDMPLSQTREAHESTEGEPEMQRSDVTEVDQGSTESSCRCLAREDERQLVIKLSTGVAHCTAVDQPTSRHVHVNIALW